MAVDDTDGLVLLCGAVPGPKNGWVLISDAVKKKMPDDAPFPAGLVGSSDGIAVEDILNEDSKSEVAPQGASESVERPSEEATVDEVVVESEKE